MSATLVPMSTEQVRIPKEIMDNVRIIAAAFGQGSPEYVREVLAKAVKRDLPKAQKIISERIDRTQKDQEE